MKAAVVHSLSPHHLLPSIFTRPTKNLSILRALNRSQETEKAKEIGLRAEYRPGVFDDLFLNVFRNNMVQEVGWDSEKPGFDGLIEVANHLMARRSNSETKEAAVRILRALFPPLLLELYKLLIAPIQGGKVAAVMVARVTALSCQWLMGPCAVNSVDLPDGSSLNSGVFVEKCKYLEESKCVGICINTCKLPTQVFFKDYMGVPLLMEPNFNDYSCQVAKELDLKWSILIKHHITVCDVMFKFGVPAHPPEQDSALKEPCLEICPTATRRRKNNSKADQLNCPKA